MNYRTELNTWNAAHALTRLGGIIAPTGLKVVPGSDFHEAAEKLKGTGKKLTENFDPKYNTFTPRNAFWIALTRSDGSWASFQAYSFEDLGRDMSVQDYLFRYWPRVFSENSGNQVELSKDQYRYMDKLRGKVAYAGELWVDDEYRRAGIASAFAKIGFISAILQPSWELDWLYGFTNPDTGSKGFTTTLGARSAVPMGLQWVNEPTQHRPDLWFFYFDRISLLDLIDQTATAPQLAQSGLPIMAQKAPETAQSDDNKASDKSRRRKRASKKPGQKRAHRE